METYKEREDEIAKNRSYVNEGENSKIDLGYDVAKKSWEKIISAKESFESGDFEQCMANLSSFLKVCQSDDPQLFDVFTDTGFCDFLLSQLSSLEDIKCIDIIIRCISRTIARCHDLSDKYLENELLPMTANIIKPPINPATDDALELINIIAENKPDEINIFIEFVPIEMIYSVFQPMFEIIEKTKNINKLNNHLTNEIGKYCKLFSKYSDLNIDQANAIIEMAAVVMKAEMDGSEHMIYALINLMESELFLVDEFFAKDFNNIMDSLMRVSTHYLAIAICEMFNCLIRKGWNCEGFPVEQMLDLLDNNEASAAQIKVCKVFQNVLESGNEEVLHNIMETNGYRTFAKLVKEDCNENFSGKAAANVKGLYSTMVEAAKVLTAIIQKIPASEAYQLGQNTVIKALVEIAEIGVSDLVIAAYKSLSIIMQSFIKKGEVDEFVKMFYEENGSEKLIDIDIEDDEELEAHDEFISLFPEDML